MVASVKLSEIVKRKRDLDEDDSDIDISSTDSENESQNSDDEDQEIVNIDFDFFNGNKNVDFHAFKNLLRQLFGPQESNRIQLSALADLMLDSPTTTIKTDGQESDPYCFLSLIDYKENKACDYAKYLHKTDERLSQFLKSSESTNKKCALVLSERLINMPPEVISPLYRITLDDVSNTLGGGSHYDYYIIVSRKFEVNTDMDDDKKSVSRKRVKTTEVDYFHEEDKFFEGNAKLHFESESRKGVISSYIIIDHDGLKKSIDSFEKEVATW
ncbi:LAFE_0F02938g1_1 [Lachancea fermentati]|uniref:Protein BCP1 n=1 Tax=Lachancea fermentati TaxID=4955 RepID=A0A1G4MEE5_LACFM|nr:LAFE_0F02938g1_1 [Lachancea fermentati]